MFVEFIKEQVWSIEKEGWIVFKLRTRDDPKEIKIPIQMEKNT